MDRAGTADDLRGGVTEDEVASGLPDVVKKLSEPGGDKKLSGEEALDATEWFLSDEHEDEEHAVKVLDLNISMTPDEKWIQWHIRPLNSDEMRDIQRKVSGNRQQRRQSSEPDNMMANLMMVVEATLYPDLRAASLQKGVQDATHTLKHRFRNKPGLIQQIAAEVLLFSGFDEDDVREAREVRAAGN